MSTVNTVARRTALTTVLISAMCAISANAADESKFTWWAIMIMMIGIVTVFSLVLVIYFCCFRKEEEKEAQSDTSAGVPAANEPRN